MLGYPASPLAIARHILDYPPTDHPFDYDQYPLATRTPSPPPPRPPRPDTQGPTCVSPKPVRAYRPSWMSSNDPSGDRDIDMSSSSPKDEPTTPQPQLREAPSTPKSQTRSTRGTPVHKYSPVTPSRLSLPPITAENTHDFTPESEMDSPYRPLYVVPRRHPPDVFELVEKKALEFFQFNGPKPLKPRRRTISEQRVSSSKCRIADVEKEPQSLADTVRRLIHRYPEVSKTIPTAGPSPRTVPSVKTKPRAYSFGALADKYTQASLNPNRPTRSPSPPSPPVRQSSSRRYGPFTSSPNSPSKSSPPQSRNQANSPINAPRRREASNDTSYQSSFWPTYENECSSPMERDSPEHRVTSPHSPKTPTPKSLGRSAFYGHPNSPLRHENSSVRPMSIDLPPPPSYESLTAELDADYPSSPRGTGPKPSRPTSSSGALWPKAQNHDKAAVPWTSTKEYDSQANEFVIITSPPDFSRQYKRVGDKTLDESPKREDITMQSWNEEDAEGEVEYELETCPAAPKAKSRVTLDSIAEGAWLSGKQAKDTYGREPESSGESFMDADDNGIDQDEPPFEMPPTPRLAKATLPPPSRFGKQLQYPDVPPKGASSNDTPAFLTPFNQRVTHPHDRSAEYVLAQTRKREANIIRTPPGTMRPRKKRAQREITNLCIFTLQRNFSKALLDIQLSPTPKQQLPLPPVVDHAPPDESPWWGGRLSPPSKHAQLPKNSDEENDSDVDDYEDDYEMEDRGLWAEQSYGIGLGLGLGVGFDFKIPSLPREYSARSLPEKFGDQHSPSPPLVRTPSDKGKTRASVSFNGLSPALDLADRPPKGGPLTPSPTSPEVVTPEFDTETGKRTVLVKENYKEHPGSTYNGYNGPWNLRLPPAEEDEDDRPFWAKPAKKDKGKGRAVPDIDEQPPAPETLDEVPTIIIPDFIPIDPTQSDEVNYGALADAFGVDADELAMQYMLEMSKLDMGKTAEEIACGDSPGASGSGLPPCHSWTEDEDSDVDVEMSDESSGPSRSSSSDNLLGLSSTTPPTISTSFIPCTDTFPAAFNSWYNGHTNHEAENDNSAQTISAPQQLQEEYRDELNEISELMDPLHLIDNADDSDDINDNANDFDDIHDTIRMMPTGGADDDLNDHYDYDDVPNDYDYDDDNDDTNDGDDTDYEDNDTGDDDDADDDYDTDDNYDTEDDGYDSENDNDSLRTDDNDSPLRTDDEHEPQDLDENVDQKHLSSNEDTIMNRILMPHFTFTPPSPQVGGDRPQVLRFGHEDDFPSFATRSPYLRVPEASRATSSADSPPFFRLAPAYQQPGNSGEEFANRMFTKWNSLKSRRRVVHKGSREFVPDDGTGFRPTKLRRIVEEE